MSKKGMDSRQLLLDQASEANFQATVLETAGYLGWRRYHSFDSRRDNEKAGVDRGFPDLILARWKDGELHPRVLVIELKREDGRVSSEQREWMRIFEGIEGIECYVFRPRDGDEIERVLK